VKLPSFVKTFPVAPANLPQGIIVDPAAVEVRDAGNGWGPRAANGRR